MKTALNCAKSVLSSILLISSYTATANECGQINKFGLCTNTAGCAWIEKYCHGRCIAFDDEANINTDEDSDEIAPVPVCQPEYLGCTFDESQCRDRAAHAGYSRYRAERSDQCPNAAKFGCWGKAN